LHNAPEPLRFSGEVGGDPKLLLEEVCRRGLEGVIGKLADSVYEPGSRSRSWIKLKCSGQQEFVIGGYTLPDGARKHFGALLVGYYEGGKLRFAGKVGTGFNHALLKSIHRRMEEQRRESCPFSDLPEKTAGKWAQNITPSEMRRCRWTEPQLVCQIRFTEWTRDGKLRHPVFLGLREDKAAREVVREKPVSS
jgi:bifunctional non-homologous end joining protein LigD